MSHVTKVMVCPHCRSQQLSKNGYRRGKQCYLCKDCGKQFVDYSTRSNFNASVNKLPQN